MTSNLYLFLNNQTGDIEFELSEKEIRDKYGIYNVTDYLDNHKNKIDNHYCIEKEELYEQFKMFYKSDSYTYHISTAGTLYRVNSLTKQRTRIGFMKNGVECYSIEGSKARPIYKLVQEVFSPSDYKSDYDETPTILNSRGSFYFCRKYFCAFGIKVKFVKI